MTRECRADFLRLEEYISNYSISCNLNKNDYVAAAKRMHKVYFSLINWHVEYKYQLDLFSKEYTSNKDVLVRLSETVSDIGSSQFNWLNGSYKAARVMLRSAIENFVRALGAIEDNSLLAEKSVFKVFEKANNSSVFNTSNTINNAYQLLHSRYVILCKDTHTATSNNMEHITSLADYPQYIASKSDSTKDLFVSIVQNILLILCLTFNKIYHSMHHRNKENVLNSIPTSYKRFIQDPTITSQS